MDQVVDLSQGGIAVVMVGATGRVQEYEHDPRVLFVDCKTTGAELLNDIIPANTKVAILTEGIPTYHNNWICSFARRKGIPFILRKSNQAIYDYLKSCIPNGDRPSIEEVQETSSRGKLKPLAHLIDLSKSNTENGRILMREVTRLGIATTEGSVIQFVSKHRRAQSGGTVPKSARPKLDVSVDLLENTIRDLSDLKEFLVATVEENRILKAKIAKFEAAFQALK